MIIAVIDFAEIDDTEESVEKLVLVLDNTDLSDARKIHGDISDEFIRGYMSGITLAKFGRMPLVIIEGDDHYLPVMKLIDERGESQAWDSSDPPPLTDFDGFVQ